MGRCFKYSVRIRKRLRVKTVIYLKAVFLPIDQPTQFFKLLPRYLMPRGGKSSCNPLLAVQSTGEKRTENVETNMPLTGRFQLSTFSE